LGLSADDGCGQSGIAVVEAGALESGLCERHAELVVPVQHLSAHSHYQQQRVI
jgi:hypothetical protein